MKRLAFEEVQQGLKRVLLKYDFSEERAELSSRLFAEASRDGVHSHGVNRFPRYISYIQKGYIDVHASPVCVGKIGSMEQWDGQLGPGNLNAYACMERTMELAKEHGMGLVAIRNTNHWMRGGTYGWQAADAGFISICFTNTQPNTPAWGTKSIVIGNNPLIMALPREQGHIVLDTAMTQFSFGKLESYRRAGKQLPVPGGFDADGNISHDPAAIEDSGRALSIGFWKGSGLTLILDLMASALSGGMCTTQIGKQGPDEYNVVQVFMAIDPFAMGNANHCKQIIAETLQDLHTAKPSEEGGSAYYPGERTLRTRKESMELGVLVDEGYWAEISRM